MEDLEITNIPVAGRIQHGEQIKENNRTRAVEYGYFIPKIKDSNLQFLANRFNEIYNKKKAILIRIINENPFTIRRVKYNQGGTNCYCKNGEIEAKRKVSNKWESINCTEDCPHRVKQDGAKKPLCNREGRLIFMLPKINNDKIWDMKITSQEVINTLDSYFKLQKITGNSIKGDYIVYLKQKEQQASDGNIYKNTLVDIIKKEDFISQNSNKNILQNQIPENQTNLSTETQQNVETLPENSSKSELKEQKDAVKTETSNETKSENKQETKAKSTTTKKTSKKASTEKSKENTTNKEENKQEKIITEIDKIGTDNMDNYYVLYQTSTKQLIKDGKPTDCLFGGFADMQDKMIDVAIPPNLKEELLQCDIGTLVELELGTKGTLTFAKSIKYIDKRPKNVAA